MNYCLLEDAWGKHNHITNQYKEYNNSIKRQTVENFEPKINYDYSNNNHNNHKHHNYNCDNFINHLSRCSSCSNRVRNKYRSRVMDNIQNIITDNKDAIVLILMGIFILLFINLVFSLTKN